jgi:hypothetical protein
MITFSNSLIVADEALTWRGVIADGLMSVLVPSSDIGSPALELRFHECDLIGVDVELLRQLSQRSIALDGGKRPGLEGRRVFRRSRLLINFC